jgi:VanZ family protein
VTRPSRSVWRVALALLAATTAALALTPDPGTAIDTGWDKLNHLLAFAAMGLCAQSSAADPGRPAWAWLGLVLAFGVFIEAAQAQIPGRHAEAADLLADALGIACGAAPALLYWRRRPAVQHEREP